MEQKIKGLQTIHMAICAALVIAYIIVGKPTAEILDVSIDSSSAIYLVIPLVAIVVGHILFKSQLKQADRNKSLEENIPIYQTASVIRWALLEGAAFLILFLQPSLIIVGIALIAYLIYLRPTKAKIETDLANA